MVIDDRGSVDRFDEVFHLGYPEPDSVFKDLDASCGCG
jgi:hypothetical protein